MISSSAVHSDLPIAQRSLDRFAQTLQQMLASPFRSRRIEFEAVLVIANRELERDYGTALRERTSRTFGLLMQTFVPSA